MTLKYIPISKYNDLKQHIIDNASFYTGNSLLELENLVRSTNIEIIYPDLSETNSDAQNAQLIYEAMKELTPAQAADERYWCYLTHVKYIDYMRKRWNPSSDKENTLYNSILDRFFLRGRDSRALNRNGIARLWWGAYLTYDQTLEDPYKYTKMIFEDQDLHLNLLERTFGRNKKILKVLLDYIKEKSQRDITYQEFRDFYRNISKLINRLGGIKILDLLDKEYIYQYLDQSLQI